MTIVHGNEFGIIKHFSIYKLETEIRLYNQQGREELKSKLFYT